MEYLIVQDLGVISLTEKNKYHLEIPYIKLSSNHYNNLLSGSQSYVLIMYDTNSVLSNQDNKNTITSNSINKSGLYVHFIVHYSKVDKKIKTKRGNIVLNYKALLLQKI